MDGYPQHRMFYSQALPKTTKSAAKARRALDRLKGKVDDEALANARLLVSELVTNAVQHVEEDGELELRVNHDGDRLRVEVRDPGRGFTVTPRRPDSPRGSGWGLHFVDELADRWAAEARRGSAVWFEVRTR
jgi:anti-sigma regulatory factor (Ser/Thr protein kinase)